MTPMIKYSPKSAIHFFLVLFLVKGHFTILNKSNVYTNVSVRLTPNHCSLSIIFFFNYTYNIVDNSTTNIRDFLIVNIPGNGTLLTFNHFVCDR